jgi:preprotein translocase subunit SecG
MWSVILAVHIILCVFLIIVILLQSGKGSDIGAAFGGSSQTVFGASGGATFLSKLTTMVAIGFLVTCLTLAFMSSRRHQSSIIKNKTQVEQKATDTKTETAPSAAQPGAATGGAGATGETKPAEPAAKQGK